MQNINRKFCGILTASGSYILALGEHGVGPLADSDVLQVVAEEDLWLRQPGHRSWLRRVGLDVHGDGGRAGDQINLRGLAAGTADIVGLTFGSLDDQHVTHLDPHSWAPVRVRTTHELHMEEHPMLGDNAEHLGTPIQATDLLRHIEGRYGATVDAEVGDVNPSMSAV